MMRRVARHLSFLLVAVLLLEIFIWSAEEGKKQQAVAIEVPYVSAPAFAEALAQILPDATTFTLTGIALGSGVILYYAGKQLYDWAVRNGYLPPTADTINTSLSSAGVKEAETFLSHLLPGDVISTEQTSFSAAPTLYYYDCSSREVKKVNIPPNSIYTNIIWTKYIDGKKYIYGENSICFDGDITSCNEGEIQEIGLYPVSEYCSSPEEKILSDIEKGDFIPPAPATVSTVPVPDAPVYDIPDSAISYQQTASIDWDGDGKNDTLVFPIPAGFSPTNATTDIATLLPALDALKDATLENTQKLQDILATTSEAVQQLQSLNSNVASISSSLEHINDTVSALPKEIAQSISNQMTKEAENVTTPALPSDFVFPTDLNMPSEVDLYQKFSQPVPLPSVKLNVSGVCSFPVSLPWGGSSELDFCLFDKQLESVGIALENVARVFFVFWIFW